MKYASMGRPVVGHKSAANPHGYSLLAGYLAACCVLLALAGCGAAPVLPPQKVEVPVYVPCVTGAPLVAPAYEFSSLSAAATDGEKVLALARDWPRGRAYEGQLEAAIAGCK